MVPKTSSLPRFIRARSDILSDPGIAARASFDATGKTPAFDRLLKAKSNLYRMWAED